MYLVSLEVFSTTHPMTMINNYLFSIDKQFRYYKLLGEKTFAQLSEPELTWQYNDASNSIALIVKHLYGNMLSRWTDFLTTDGEKSWRNREQEFESPAHTREDLLKQWEAGWACLFEALSGIHAQNFDTVIHIRNMGHTLPEAINRQLAHYAYHVGQIVYIGRMIKGDDWQSLSIPRGQSVAYNEEKFKAPKRKAHFTDDYLGEKEEE